MIISILQYRTLMAISNKVCDNRLLSLIFHLNLYSTANDIENADSAVTTQKNFMLPCSLENET